MLLFRSHREHEAGNEPETAQSASVRAAMRYSAILYPLVVRQAHPLVASRNGIGVRLTSHTG